MTKAQLEKITFNELAEEWLQFKKTIIKASSYYNYKFTIRTKLQKKIGNKSIAKLLKYNFNDYVSELMTYLSKKTVKDIVTLLKSILKYAEIKYEINFKTSLISAPIPTQSKVEIFEEIERKRIEKYCLNHINNNNEELKCLGIIICLYTGMRIGEICALKWKDIDFENRCININHTLQRVYIDKNKTKITYESPKTKKSIRTIPMANIVYEKLRIFSKKYTNNSFILTGKDELYIEPLRYRYMYKKILNECSLEYKKFHVLRHTFATRCIGVGMDVKSLSEILGHSNVSVTLNIYVHSSFKIKSKYINRL